MKKILFFAFILLYTENAFSQEYSINILKNKSLEFVEVLLYTCNEDFILKTKSIDTIIHIDGHKNDLPIVYIQLANMENIQKIYLIENEIVTIKILDDGLMEFNDSVNALFVDIKEKSKYYSNTYNDIYKEIRKTNQDNKSKIDSLYFIYRVYRDSSEQYKLKKIKKIKKSYAVVDYLLNECKRKVLQKDTLLALLKKLDFNYYKKFKNFYVVNSILNMKILEEGDYVKKIQLLDRKKVLLDNNDKLCFIFFWDTQCKNSLREFEYISKWTEQNTKSIRIIGLNFDYEVSNYKNFIEKNNVKFENYHCSEGFLSNVSNLFWASKTPYGIGIKDKVIVKKQIAFSEFVDFIMKE